MKFQDLRQTKEYTLFLKTQGWQIERIGESFVFIKKLPFLPISVIKIQRPKKSKLSFDFSRIDKIAKKHHAIFVKIEPFENSDEEELKKAGFKKDSWPLLPPRTLWIELGQSEKELLADFDKKTRYDLRKTVNAGLKIKIVSGDKLKPPPARRLGDSSFVAALLRLRRSGGSSPSAETGGIRLAADKLKENQLENFYEFFKSARKGKKLWMPHFNYLESLLKSFGNQSYLLLAYSGKEIVAGVVLLFSQNMAFYYFSASSREGNEVAAPTVLTWQAIELSKKQNKKIFDFEGIYDPRFKVTKPWQGFSHFKKGFGGEEIEYPGSFLKFYNPVLKFISKLRIPI